jgi:hypothetical protein
MNGEALGKWTLVELLAVGWSEDMAARFPNAVHAGCRQEMHAGEDGLLRPCSPPRCMGWHCNRCGKATSSYGHHMCPDRPAAPTGVAEK